jgi:hypothetical protein
VKRKTKSFQSWFFFDKKDNIIVSVATTRGNPEERETKM